MGSGPQKFLQICSRISWHSSSIFTVPTDHPTWMWQACFMLYQHISTISTLHEGLIWIQEAAVFRWVSSTPNSRGCLIFILFSRSAKHQTRLFAGSEESKNRACDRGFAPQLLTWRTCLDYLIKCNVCKKSCRWGIRNMGADLSQAVDCSPERWGCFGRWLSRLVIVPG